MAVWSELPEEIIIELLSRLPKDKLIEFRLVSKAYNFLIYTWFIPKLAVSAPLSGLVFHSLRLEYPSSTMRNGKKFNPMRSNEYLGINGRSDDKQFMDSWQSLFPFKNCFVSCSNGFLLLLSKPPVHYYLRNPATKQCIAIPENPNQKLDEEYPRFVGLAFDPLDPPPHNFKIVLIASCPDIDAFDRPLEFDVFSSDTGKWVNHPVPLKSEIIKFGLNRRSAYLNGVFYMLSSTRYLVCFNLISDNNDNNNHRTKLDARAIKLPHTSSIDNLGLIEASNECLYYAGEVEFELHVWILQAIEESSPWILKYRIDIRNLSKLESGGHLLDTPSIVFAVDLSTETIYLGTNDLIYKYNIKTNQLVTLLCLRRGRGQEYIGRPYVFPYSTCLVKLSDCNPAWTCS